MGARSGPIPAAPSERFITVEDFARLARLSRRTIDRYRHDRPPGFPKEYDVSRGKVPRPRFKLADVLVWMESRALW
jgi:predicted DNA-binding transcriptional regulator AlpA